MNNSTSWSLFEPGVLFPPGYSSKDIPPNTPGALYPKPQDLLLIPVYGVALVILRIIYERTIGKRLATQFFDIKVRKYAYKRNDYLESVYKQRKRPSEEEMSAIAKKLSWRQVEVINWFIRRRNSERPDLLTKFCEASWRFLFYTGSFTLGMSILLQAPWFYDTLNCWADNYPYQIMWKSVYYYYMLEGGFYFSLLLTLLRDVRRKDFLEMVIHHFATLFLIFFSYIANFLRLGTLVMAIHDISDIILELAKCFLYKGHKVADDIFTAFAITFIVSRIFVYPYMILYTSVVKSLWVFEPYFGYYFLNGMLVILQILHLFWAHTIISMAIRMARVGKVEKDARSDAAEESIDEGDGKPIKDESKPHAE